MLRNTFYTEKFKSSFVPESDTLEDLCLQVFGPDVDHVVPVQPGAGETEANFQLGMPLEHGASWK